MRTPRSSSARRAPVPPSRGPDGGKDPGGEGSVEGDYLDWLTLGNREKGVSADVRRLRSHPLVPRNLPIHGYLYDVKTGRLEAVSAGGEKSS